MFGKAFIVCLMWNVFCLIKLAYKNVFVTSFFIRLLMGVKLVMATVTAIKRCLHEWNYKEFTNHWLHSRRRKPD